MPSDMKSAAMPIMLLAAASGARSLIGVAAVARARAGVASGLETRRAVPRIVRRFDSRIADAATAAAAFELMADKSPHIPDRTDPGPLFGRVVAGAIVGASIARVWGVNRRSAAIAGAAVSFAAAQLSFRLRAALASVVPGFVAGLLEDVLVVGVAAAGSALLLNSENA
jgi:uncharacterized membrane protein